MTTRVALEPAWVLHARPYRDTSLLVESLTRDHGRVGLVARGVRGPRGRLRALLQPLQPLLMSWSGRGELATLAACEGAGAAYALRDEALLSAWYANEVLLRVLQRGDPQPTVHESYGRLLAALAAGADPAATLRVFEKRLLDALGWGAAYDHLAADGAPVEPGRHYGFAAERGVVAAGAGEVDVDGAALLALAHEDLSDPAVAADARRVLRAALAPHLGDKPLETRTLLKAWRARR